MLQSKLQVKFLPSMVSKGETGSSVDVGISSSTTSAMSLEAQTCHTQSAAETLNWDRAGHRKDRGQCHSLAKRPATASSPLTAFTFIPRYTQVLMESSKNNFPASASPCSSLHMGTAPLKKQSQKHAWISQHVAEFFCAWHTNWLKTHLALTKDMENPCFLWVLVPFVPPDSQGNP